MVQISAVGTISVGIVLVLLIGEIDLSVGAVSGLCAGIMAVLSVKSGLPAPIAVGAGVLAGAAIGLLRGFWIARLRVPSFIVTLAGYLGWQSALLYVLGDTGTVNLTDPWIIGIANARLPVLLGWLLGIVFVGVYALGVLGEQRRRTQASLQTQSLAMLAGRIALVATGVFLTIGLMSVNRSPQGFTPVRGIPLAVLLFIGFIIVFDVITRRTPFGRYVFAVGGNPEAARRAGVNVGRIRMVVFILGSTLAACGGILAGSRLLAVSSSVKFMVTGAVLLLAVTLDAYTRSRRESTGRQ